MKIILIFFKPLFKRNHLPVKSNLITGWIGSTIVFADDNDDVSLLPVEWGKEIGSRSLPEVMLAAIVVAAAVAAVAIVPVTLSSFLTCVV